MALVMMLTSMSILQPRTITVSDQMQVCVAVINGLEWPRRQERQASRQTLDSSLMGLQMQAAINERRTEKRCSHVSLDRSVVGPEIVERGVQLLHECNEQHSIADSQLALGYALHNCTAYLMAYALVLDHHVDVMDMLRRKCLSMAFGSLIKSCLHQLLGADKGSGHPALTACTSSESHEHERFET